MNVTIVLLDGESFEMQNLEKGTLGKTIFTNACERISLKDEIDYFGLRFINKKDGEFQWVDNARSIQSQLGKENNENTTHYLHFAVKFFPVNPTNIKQDLTRYQFVLQLRESLLNGRLECSMPIYALLASFIVQAEFGDYNPEEHGKDYLDDFKFCPDQPPELIEKVQDYHRKHKKMSPEQAELNFLDNVRKLPVYGVHRHLALDVNSEKVFIGVSNVGVTVYRGSRLMSTFVWPKILSVGFKSKKFYIKIKPHDEDDDYCKTSVGFKLTDRVAAKRLWKTCVEHHTFFRLENVDLAEKKGLLSRFGSPFRYRGKTENEIVHGQLGPEPTFSRVSSKRFSERVLKSNRKEPEDVTPEIKTETVKTEVPPPAPKEAADDNIPVKTPPVIEVEEVVEVSKQEVVETTPIFVKSKDDIPEIKVVEASPELKLKSKEDNKGETVKEEEEKKKEVESVEEGEKVEVDSAEDDEEKNGEDVEETNTNEEPSNDETQLVISNPFAEESSKSYTSHSVTTTSYTTQSSTDDGDPITLGDSSTLISSAQVITNSETTHEVVTTTTTSSTTSKTLLEQTIVESSST